jgi:hypothetical protein
VSTDPPDDFLDESRAVDRRLARQSMEIVSTDGPYSEVTFRAPHWRSSDLTFEDATKFFDFISFNMWEYGAVFNCHITITWGTLAAALLSLYLNECEKWMEVGLSWAALVGQPHQPRRRREGFGSRFRYAYIHAMGATHGFHSHVLTHLGREELPYFRAWTRNKLTQLARHPGTSKSVRVIRGRERNDPASIRRLWEWYCYLIKQLPPDVGCGDRSSGEPFIALREFLKPGRRTWDYIPGLGPVSCKKLVGASHDLSHQAQQATGFRSWCLWSRRNRLFVGRELDNWQEWQHQKALAHPHPITRPARRPDE